MNWTNIVHWPYWIHVWYGLAIAVVFLLAVYIGRKTAYRSY